MKIVEAQADGVMPDPVNADHLYVPLPADKFTL